MSAANVLQVERLEIDNFKSYARVVVKPKFPLPAHGFAESSGRNDLLDAINFVFGKQERDLHVTKLSELIHNPDGDRIVGKKSYVSAVLKLGDEATKFQRTLRVTTLTDTTTEYRINGKFVKSEEYLETLTEYDLDSLLKPAPEPDSLPEPTSRELRECYRLRRSTSPVEFAPTVKEKELHKAIKFVKEPVKVAENEIVDGLTAEQRELQKVSTDLRRKRKQRKDDVQQLQLNQDQKEILEMEKSNLDKQLESAGGLTEPADARLAQKKQCLLGFIAAKEVQLRMLENEREELGKRTALLNVQIEVLEEKETDIIDKIITTEREQAAATKLQRDKYESRTCSSESSSGAGGSGETVIDGPSVSGSEPMASSSASAPEIPLVASGQLTVEDCMRFLAANCPQDRLKLVLNGLLSDKPTRKSAAPQEDFKAPNGILATGLGSSHFDNRMLHHAADVPPAEVDIEVDTTGESFSWPPAFEPAPVDEESVVSLPEIPDFLPDDTANDPTDSQSSPVPDSVAPAVVFDRLTMEREIERPSSSLNMVLHTANAISPTKPAERLISFVLAGTPSPTKHVEMLRPRSAGSARSPAKLIEKRPGERLSRRYKGQCPQCPFRSYGYAFEAHLLCHERKDRYKCPSCTYSSNLAPQVRAHVKLHDSVALPVSTPTQKPPSLQGPDSSSTPTKFAKLPPSPEKPFSELSRLKAELMAFKVQTALPSTDRRLRKIGPFPGGRLYASYQPTVLDAAKTAVQGMKGKSRRCKSACSSREARHRSMSTPTPAGLSPSKLTQEIVFPYSDYEFRRTATRKNSPSPSKKTKPAALCRTSGGRARKPAERYDRAEYLLGNEPIPPKRTPKASTMSPEKGVILPPSVRRPTLRPVFLPWSVTTQRKPRPSIFKSSPASKPLPIRKTLYSASPTAAPSKRKLSSPPPKRTSNTPAPSRPLNSRGRAIRKPGRLVELDSDEDDGTSPSTSATFNKADLQKYYTRTPGILKKPGGKPSGVGGKYVPREPVSAGGRSRKRKRVSFGKKPKIRFFEKAAVSEYESDTAEEEDEEEASDVAMSWRLSDSPLKKRLRSLFGGGVKVEDEMPQRRTRAGSV